MSLIINNFLNNLNYLFFSAYFAISDLSSHVSLFIAFSFRHKNLSLHGENTILKLQNLVFSILQCSYCLKTI